MIRIEHISKTYGTIKVLDDVSIEIPSGKITVILGPSGAGKTTLLRIIAGLEEPEEGKVFIDGEDVTTRPPWERRVAMVFQTPALFPHLTAFENIAFGLETQEIQQDEVKERVQWAAKLTRIDHLLSKRPEQLSGGEQQRVALARALVVKPRILLLDEPLSNLDLALREELRLELKRIQRETGITFIHVTHDQDEALELADYLVVIYKGKIVEHGDPIRVYERTKTVMAAKVFGHNIIEAKSLKKILGQRVGQLRIDEDLETKLLAIPQHKVLIRECGPSEGCVVKKVLYRRNHGLLILDCGGVTLKAAVSLNELLNYRENIRVCVTIEELVKLSAGL